MDEKMTQTDEKMWYYVDNGVKSAPVTELRLRELITARVVDRETLVTCENMDTWEPASSILALLEPARLSSPAPAPSAGSSASPEKPAPGPSGRDTTAHPWGRYFARVVDLYIWSFIFTFLLGAGSVFIPSLAYIYSSEGCAVCFLLPVLTIGTLAMIEPFFLSMFGTTLGKWFFNVQVHTACGQKLTYKEALYRTFGVVVKGMAFNIPFLSWLTMLASANDLLEKGKTSWDRDGGYVVSHGPAFWRILLMIALFFGAFVLLAPLTA